MTAHQILVEWVFAKQNLHEVKTKTLRLDGRRQSDQLAKRRMARELLDAECALLEAEHRATLYAASYQEE